MEKWEIRPTPSADDPDRHVLLLRGGPADVAALLKKFGALMGRPSPAQAEGYNLSLVLHRLKPAAREKLDAWLEKAAPSAPPPAALHDFVPSPVPAPSPEVPSFSIPALKPPGPEKPMPVLVPPPVPAPALQPAAPAAAPPPARAPAEYALSVELRADWTFETLLVGAYNRFAHAAAMSVVTSPGTMYNPLFLYGVPGTGKSHMLNAIGAALSKGRGGAGLISTSGSRLSRAVGAALARKGAAEVDARAAGAGFLLIDDIHLMAISDQNKDAIAKMFKSFFDRKLQVVITSLYPPRSLGALEEALKFSFSKGWSVDLKTPSPSIQKDLISASAGRARTGLDGEEISLLHEKLSQYGYSDLTVWLKRASLFKKARAAAGLSSALRDLLPLIYEPTLGSGAEPPQPSPFSPPPPPPGAEPMAVIVPKGQEGLGTFAARSFYEVGPKNGFKEVYRHALWEAYDPAVPFGVPFLIGELCSRAGVTRALVVGPAPDSPLGPRSAELAHATRRILESFGIEMAFIPYAGLRIDAHYLNAHLDLARLPPPS